MAKLRSLLKERLDVLTDSMHKEITISAKKQHEKMVASPPEEAHSYPLTSVPLSLATPERDLRQGPKSTFRNYLMEESASVGYEPMDNSTWLIDGMAAVNSIPPKPTWREYADALLKFCLPPSKSKPVQLGIIFDSYCTVTTKELTQIRRGTPGRRIYITNADQSMPRGKDWNLSFAMQKIRQSLSSSWLDILN